ncbi:hypothetical protein NJH83_15760 [Pseudomonas chlororaphis]|uniref:hypothetical protein n=1 Tax=Pseudomonas chlororaphis TaxID=587753 RepID=UPI00209B969E|nr:hypothetical protein [Pseudomonas chlororaphis]MCO7611696.1 hypothetical protein [Pseudomonas chlororaphis]
MSQARNELQAVIATLGELHAVLERLRGEFVQGIKTDEILAYQRHSEQFRESNAAFEATCPPRAVDQGSDGNARAHGL